MNFRRLELPPGLTFVGVPIGTARDITLRALDVLASADLLAAEDTRSLRKLMDIHGIPLDGRRIIALHDHSGASQVARLVEEVKGGASLAYASEAGMPLIADPGFELGRAMREAGLSVTAAPGPSALTTAMAVSGMPTDRFHFAGFLPSTANARRKALAALAGEVATLVFFESPKRLAAMLRDAAETLGAGREAAVCRELTKKFEEVQRGPLADLIEYYEQNPPKGEIVVLIDRGAGETVSEMEIEQALGSALETMRVKDASQIVAERFGLARRDVYQMALGIMKGKSDAQ
ncbi:MAG: 16S rRNA (cytidine(1402)-2'-O)-methyltransferase [Pseudomonadota bacterium]